MKMGLTVKQNHMKKTITEFIQEHEYSPTYRELGKISGGIHVSAVARLVHQLHERGHISILPGQERSIVILD